MPNPTLRLAFVAASIALIAVGWLTAQSARQPFPVVFSGGHDTDPRDGGRPVALIAAALEVPTPVFREAFRGVTPAKNGKPTPEQARANKSALMKVLKPHGVDNDWLDEVSNYYRYRPQEGELWRVVEAKAHAIVEDGQVKRIVIDERGSGYSSPPHAVVQGLEKTPLKVSIAFAKDVKKNGAVSAIEVDSAKAK